jgi:predicted small lipoprotein YifL
MSSGPATPPCHRGPRSAALIIVVLATVLLAGCGKKGNPSPPPGQPVTFPQSYPKT